MKIIYFSVTDRADKVIEVTLDDLCTSLVNDRLANIVYKDIWFYERDISPNDLTHRDEIELPWNLLKVIAEITRRQHMGASFPNGIGLVRVPDSRKLGVHMTLVS